MTSRVGTAQWNAPEIIARSAYGQPADVYAFGIICWEVAARAQPYTGLSQFALSKKVVEGTRPPVDRSWPTKLVAVMEACWQHEPMARPDFAAVVRVLAGADVGLLASEAGSSGAPSAWTRSVYTEEGSETSSGAAFMTAGSDATSV